MERTGAGRGWREVLPGLTILGVLVVASTLTFLMDGIRRLFSEGPRIVVLAAEAKGLQPGSTVWVAGKPAGRVLEIRFDVPSAPESSRVVIESVLRRDALPELRADARAAIGSSALLAPAVLKLSPGTATAPPLESGDTLQVDPTPDLRRFRELADTVSAAIERLREDGARLRARLVEGPGTISRYVGDPAAAASLDSVAVRSRRLATRLREGNGLARLARDDSLHAALRRLDDSREMLASASRAARSPDSLAALAEATVRLTERAARLAEGLASARGTAGRALHDPALRDRAADAREAAGELGPALAADPWRWLRIRLF
jgi:ABC-type transporter Mla subunit MlaD